MKKAIAICAAAAALAVAAPTGASAAPGQDIKAACGASFGQLISGAKKAGTSVHSNYAGGAKAFSDPAVLALHCPSAG
jgi:hypothetical protein